MFNGRFAILHDIVVFPPVQEGGNHGVAVVVGIDTGRYGERATMCRFWLPVSGVLGPTPVPISDKDMEKGTLIGALPLWAEWD